jgi:hypothetical protein
MIRPLVLSRQPCITPGAGHSLGKGFAGSGGGGGGDEDGGGPIWGSVVNGSDWAALNRAHPEPANITAHTTAATTDIRRRDSMSPDYGLSRSARHAGQQCPLR